MDGEVTQEADEDYPWWVKVLSAVLSFLLGAALAAVALYYLFIWWVNTA